MDSLQVGVSPPVDEARLGSKPRPLNGPALPSSGEDIPRNVQFGLSPGDEPAGRTLSRLICWPWGYSLPQREWLPPPPPVLWREPRWGNPIPAPAAQVPPGLPGAGISWPVVQVRMILAWPILSRSSPLPQASPASDISRSLPTPGHHSHPGLKHLAGSQGLKRFPLVGAVIRSRVLH